MADRDLDQLIQTVCATGGPLDPQFEPAILDLLKMGKPALLRFLQVIDGSADVPRTNPYGVRALHEVFLFTLMRLGKQNPKAFLRAVREGNRLEKEEVVGALASIKDD